MDIMSGAALALDIRMNAKHILKSLQLECNAAGSTLHEVDARGDAAHVQKPVGEVDLPVFPEVHHELIGTDEAHDQHRCKQYVPYRGNPHERGVVFISRKYEDYIAFFQKPLIPRPAPCDAQDLETVRKMSVRVALYIAFPMRGLCTWCDTLSNQVETQQAAVFLQRDQSVLDSRLMFQDSLATFCTHRLKQAFLMNLDWRRILIFNKPLAVYAAINATVTRDLQELCWCICAIAFCFFLGMPLSDNSLYPPGATLKQLAVMNRHARLVVDAILEVLEQIERWN